MNVVWLVDVEEGMRVRVVRDLDFTPFFEVKEGSTGRVNFVNRERGQCGVVMDELIEGCMDNEVFFNCRGCDYPHSSWFMIEEVCVPLPKE